MGIFEIAVLLILSLLLAVVADVAKRLGSKVADGVELVAWGSVCYSSFLLAVFLGWIGG